MASEPTNQAHVIAPFGVIQVPARRTAPGGMVFVHQHYFHTSILGFVCDISTNTPVGPGGHALVVLLAFVRFVSDITHISYRDGPGFALPGNAHYFTGDFVLHISDTTLLLSAKALVPLF